MGRSCAVGSAFRAQNHQLHRSHPEARTSDKSPVSRLSGSPVPGLSVDKKQTDHQHKKQYRKPVSTGKHPPEIRAPSTDAETTNQSSIAAPTPAITNRNGSSSNVTATTIIPNNNCSRITAASGSRPSTENEATGWSRP